MLVTFPHRTATHKEIKLQLTRGLDQHCHTLITIAFNNCCHGNREFSAGARGTRGGGAVTREWKGRGCQATEADVHFCQDRGKGEERCVHV